MKQTKSKTEAVVQNDRGRILEAMAKRVSEEISVEILEASVILDRLEFSRDRSCPFITVKSIAAEVISDIRASDSPNTLLGLVVSNSRLICEDFDLFLLAGKFLIKRIPQFHLYVLLPGVFIYEVDAFKS
ncbi:uncharacterized protein G2W53_015358 [Senna tora]|uniref:Uncharacterized protein n=1 Tax=Senna tora TaxID=362788 RepID=A0A835C7G2_9FABA|nr:uncharacterized protein G2W53_015358 [Senna tora]